MTIFYDIFQDVFTYHYANCTHIESVTYCNDSEESFGWEKECWEPSAWQSVQGLLHLVPADCHLHHTQHRDGHLLLHRDQLPQESHQQHGYHDQQVIMSQAHCAIGI